MIEKDATLNTKIVQLQNSECDCENVNMIDWDFPVMCEILLYIAAIFFYFSIRIFSYMG